MERLSFNSFQFWEFLDGLNPQNSGIFFSIILHLIILLFAVGIPNFFLPKDNYTTNIIPIEILNIAETTNTEKTIDDSNKNVKTKTKEIKFNSSNNTNIQKQLDLNDNIKDVDVNENIINIKEKPNVPIKEKKIIEIKEKKIEKKIEKFETIKTKEIKPKVKPKPKEIETNLKNSDLKIEPKVKEDKKTKNKEVVVKPKPEEDFSIASMLKDLRNEKSNNVSENETIDQNNNLTNKDDKNKNMVLSISEIDLLRQQLSSCWNAPAGAVIERGMKVTISAKVQQNMKIYENSVRIIDTNISKSNAFYGPITDSAMRTLLNPECTPLKLPEEKYNLWKNLTITFDYSIMKGY